MLTIDWRTALTYVTREPGWRARVAVGGLLILLVPPAGWVLALGYRSIVGNRLVDRQRPLLPAWREHPGLIVVRGLLSSLVIVGYLAPFLAAFWLLGVRSTHLVFVHWREAARFAAGVVLFPPAGIPGLPVWYARRYDWLDFSALDVAVLALLFSVPIALMPAIFLQVARRRSFAAALNARDAVALVRRVPRSYVEAWFVSLAVSAIAIAIVPLAPWLLFWSYLVISHVFLQVLDRATIEAHSKSHYSARSAAVG